MVKARRAKEEAQKLRAELKMKTMLLRSWMLMSIRPAMPASMSRDGRRTRRHDQELIKILQRGKALEGYAILKELGVDPGETEPLSW